MLIKMILILEAALYKKMLSNKKQSFVATEKFDYVKRKKKRKKQPVNSYSILS